jgi:hypothetical protein
VSVDRLNRRTYILMNENPLLLRKQGFKPRAGDILLSANAIGHETVQLQKFSQSTIDVATPDCTARRAPKLSTARRVGNLDAAGPFSFRWTPRFWPL